MKQFGRLFLLLFSMTLLLSLQGCSLPVKKDAQEREAGQEEKGEEIDTHFSANTTVTYSSGTDSNWSYGNQRKEFPRKEACYARIGSTVIAEKKKGVGTEITVTYTFTGARNCNSELSDGIAEKTEGEDGDTVVFTRVLSAAKAKKAKESVIIFQYTPGRKAKSVVLLVSYDDHIPPEYDVRNTIYFSDEK